MERNNSIFRVFVRFIFSISKADNNGFFSRSFLFSSFFLKRLKESDYLFILFYIQFFFHYFYFFPKCSYLRSGHISKGNEVI